MQRMKGRLSETGNYGPFP